MRILLDSHVLVWMDNGQFTFPPRVAQILANRDSELLLSHASVWELSIKAGTGKLDFSAPLDVMVRDYIQRRLIIPLPISLEHVLAVRDLAHVHRDPFDRLIAAQAIAEDLPLITADSVFERYGVRRVWD